MHAFHGVAGLFGSHQLHGDMDPAYDENAVFRFHLTRHFRDELPIARVDATRFQRASKSAEHSTSCSRYNVVNGGRVGFRELGGIDLVMLGNRTMDAEYNRLRLPSITRSIPPSSAESHASYVTGRGYSWLNARALWGSAGQRKIGHQRR